MKDKKVIGFYDYTVILTYLGMIFAFAGIINVINDRFTQGIICLMLAGICDMFDGAVASTKGRDRYEKHFGIQIDSLCDLVSFGVLPGLFVYLYSDKSPTAGVLACLYLLAALIRLAYFNVSEYERQQVSAGMREVYLGVPVTVIAIVLPLVYALYSKSVSHNKVCFLIMLAIMSVGFISPIEIRKPRLIGKRAV